MPREDMTRMLRDSMPFAQHLGIEVDAASPQEVRAHLDHRAELCTLAGALHGGALMTLADSAGAVCAYLNLPEGAQGTSTLESKTNLLRTVRGGSAHAMSRPLHAGRRTIVVETEVRDDDGRLVAKTTQTQTVL